MKRKDEYIVGHSDRGIVGAVAMRELAEAIACQLWREHPTGGAYITHRGKTWRYTGQWSSGVNQLNPIGPGDSTSTVGDH